MTKQKREKEMAEQLLQERAYTALDQFRQAMEARRDALTALIEEANSATHHKYGSDHKIQQMTDKIIIGWAKQCEAPFDEEKWTELLYELKEVRYERRVV